MPKHLASDDLLAHTGWMTSLAQSLVLDRNEAEDVVQQAFLDVIERRPEQPRSLGAWLRGVLSHRVWKNRRAQARKRRREERAARPECLSTTPADLVERAELHRLVVDRVLALPEPYREAVLLRFFEDYSAAEVAKRQNVPLATARTRLQRGLDLLRKELDRVHGNDRRQWLTALLPIAGLGGAGTLSTATSAAALESQANTVVTTGAVSAAGQNVLQGIAVGGNLVSQKTAITVMVLTAASLALGGAVGRYTAQMDAEKARAKLGLLEKEKVSELEAELAKAQNELKTSLAERTRLEAEKSSLASRAAAVASELQTERDKLAALSAPPPSPKLPIAFGSFGELDALAAADWPEAGGAIKAMNGLMVELFTALSKGEPVDPELQKKIQEENNKLVRVAAGIMGKIPTHSAINGEFSHPLVTANLLAATLDQLELPLTKAQREAVSRLGAGYDKAYEKLQDGYSKDTPTLQKFVDELALKQDHMKKVRDTLTQAQIDAAFPASLRDRVAVDILSPGVSAIMFAQQENFKSAEAARTKLQSRFVKDFGIGDDFQSSLAAPFDAWQEEVASLLTPRPEDKSPLLVDEALIAAQAQVHLINELLQIPGLDANTRAKILAHQGWIVPRVNQAKSE